MVVVLVFVVCNVLAMVSNILEALGVNALTLTQISNLLVTLNSTVNLCIYCSFGERFRNELKHLIKKCCGHTMQFVRCRRKSSNRPHERSRSFNKGNPVRKFQSDKDLSTNAGLANVGQSTRVIGYSCPGTNPGSPVLLRSSSSLPCALRLVHGTMPNSSPKPVVSKIFNGFAAEDLDLLKQRRSNQIDRAVKTFQMPPEKEHGDGNVTFLLARIPTVKHCKEDVDDEEGENLLRAGEAGEGFSQNRPDITLQTERKGSISSKFISLTVENEAAVTPMANHRGKSRKSPSICNIRPEILF